MRGKLLEPKEDAVKDIASFTGILNRWQNIEMRVLEIWIPAALPK
jgi:hypothetical protein